MPYPDNRLNREIRLDISGFFIKNTEHNLHILNMLGFIIQKVQVLPDYFLFLSKKEESDNIYTQWIIGVRQEDVDNGYYVSIGGNVTINAEKEISADSLIALVKNNLYVFSTEYFYKNLPMKKLKKKYKLKIDFDWLEDTEYLSSNDEKLLNKYNRQMALPSKELLSAVLGKRIGKVVLIYKNYIEYEYWEDCIDNQGQDISGYNITRINVYQLAYKVKEWAKSIPIILDEPEIDIKKLSYLISSNLSDTSEFGASARIMFIDEKFRANTEPEAVFAAGEWILYQQKWNIKR